MSTPTTVTPAQRRELDDRGYFIMRQLCDLETTLQMRGVVRNWMATPEPAAGGGGGGISIQVDEEPTQPAETASFQGRMARYRKFNSFGTSCPLMWEECICGPWARVAQQVLGTDDVLLKFSSAFVKQPGGAETPFHQDNGLWRDQNVDCISVWMALDPCTRENGCLQFVPSSHRPEMRERAVVRHVTYNDSVHCELPAETAAALVDEFGVEHIELEPGDAVCWHDSLVHYSPPNRSTRSRIGIAAVFTTPAIVDRTVEAGLDFFGAVARPWVLRGGVPQRDWPPHSYITSSLPPLRRQRRPALHPHIGTRPTPAYTAASASAVAVGAAAASAATHSSSSSSSSRVAAAL